MKLDEYGDPELWGWIVTSRNILIEGRTTANLLANLERVAPLVDEVEVAGTREILRFCWPRIIEDVRQGNFKSAGWVLNLVHNMPLIAATSKKWNVDHFLKGSLVTFAEHYSEVTAARDVLLHVVEQVARDPVLRSDTRR